MKNNKILFSKAFLIILVFTGITSYAQVQDSLMTSDLGFALNSHIVATSFFHWYYTDAGQLSGPWIPKEGRENWTGEPDFWKRMIKQIMAANIDVLYVHLIPHMELQRVNLFRALYELRKEGWDVPKVAPFLDPIITWTILGHHVDVNTVAGKDEFTDQYIRFFQQYYSENPDPYADDYIYTIDGQVVLDVWHVHLHVDNYDKLTRQDVETRLQAVFGVSHPVFNYGIRLVTTALSPTFSFADEKVHQFEVQEYYIENQYKDILSVQLKPGYWDQNIREPGYILKRLGGLMYKNAWAQVDASVNRIYIESFNEYDEGSGIYAARTDTIFRTDINSETDTWSNDNDPYEYIHRTAIGAAGFNDVPDLDAKILWHNIPVSMMPGDTFTATVVVRNTGDAKWSNAGNFKFGEMESLDPVLFGPARYLIDDAQDEIPEYGGIFRGRVKTFRIGIIAPDTTGSFLTNWSMLQENVAWFGEKLEIYIAVGAEYVYTNNLTTGKNKLRVYPNPVSANGIITIAGNLEKTESVKMYNMKSQEVFGYDFQNNEGTLRINLARFGLKRGVYILEISGKHRSETHKIYVQ